jgi:hypothetical protein
MIIDCEVKVLNTCESKNMIHLKINVNNKKRCSV